MVKSSITSKHALVSVLVVQRSGLLVNALWTHVRVPARTANKNDEHSDTMVQEVP